MVQRKIRVGGKMKTFECLPIIDKCEGCGHTNEVDGENICEVYAQPATMWRDDNCIGATHVKIEIVSAAETKVNPLKASKRASRGG